jgi:hypothetical protein
LPCSEYVLHEDVASFTSFYLNFSSLGFTAVLPAAV